MALLIDMKRNGDSLTVSPEGRLDTSTAPNLDAQLRPVLSEGVKNLEIDLKALDYISSAGLRLLLSVQKIMSAQGNMVVRNVNESVMEVFQITGFTNLLTIE
ncbi:MAG: STAS domain-containing protein [Oscillibacter sp.]|nr:STAS domain-containing protein [Oscillibacter sp.]